MHSAHKRVSIGIQIHWRRSVVIALGLVQAACLCSTVRLPCISSPLPRQNSHRQRSYSAHRQTAMSLVSAAHRLPQSSRWAATPVSSGLLITGVYRSVGDLIENPIYRSAPRFPAWQLSARRSSPSKCSSQRVLPPLQRRDAHGLIWNARRIAGPAPSPLISGSSTGLGASTGLPVLAGV